MSLTYFDAACLAFSGGPFTVREFHTRLDAPRAAKLLNELKTRGLAERLGRGRYRLLAPSERPDLRRLEWDRARRAILGAPGPKAWTGPTAVELWTRGRYKVAASAFAREFHVAVPEGSVARWRAHLAKVHLSEDPRKRVGPRVVLEPRSTLTPVFLDGEPVIPRREVLRLIRANPSLYAGAEGLLIE